ncbi:MAG: transmembrane sensor [Cyclobacteriaceae bacterium]|jgi:transmembrane sensor
MTNSLNHIEDFLVDESFRKWILNPTPELDIHWTEWMDANPDKRNILLQSKDVALRLRFNEFASDLETKERISKQIKIETPDWNQPKRAIFFGQWLKVAAVLIFALGLGFLTYYLSPVNLQSDQIVEAGMVLKENPLGVRSQHTLSDGTLVTLNAGSSIRYPKKFQIDKREIILSGEAYFEVVSDSLRPFSVISNEVNVVVLGTKFNVISEEENHSVALLEGSVKVFGGASEVLLSPGQQARYNINSQNFSIESFDQRNVFDWVNGKLTFQEASFGEVKDRLMRWYGVNIAVVNQPNVLDWSYTGSFNNESLESVLLNMSMVRDFEYQIKNDSVSISF